MKEQILASAMDYQYHKVNPQLIPYIQSVVILGDWPDRARNQLPFVASGLSALLCRKMMDSATIRLFGQSAPDEEWKVETNEFLVAYFFKPFSISPIFKCPAVDLKEKPIDIENWNRKKAGLVLRHLNQANTPYEVIQTIDGFILDQVRLNGKHCELIREATDRLMGNFHAEAIPFLSQELHLTERTFQRIFKTYVGISPTEYRRICQYHFAFSQLKAGHFNKMTDVAYTNGYFDQSHYIRSFRHFTKTTPRDYLKDGLDPTSE